jgi:hypothetical protein
MDIFDGRLVVPWRALTDADEAAHLLTELRLELIPGHIIFGRDVEFVAYRQDCDQFLVALDGGEFASIHLSFNLETDPKWPETRIFSDFEAWYRE